MSALTSAEDYALAAARHLWYDGEDPRVAVARRVTQDFVNRAVDTWMEEYFGFRCAVGTGWMSPTWRRARGEDKLAADENWSPYHIS